MKKILTLDHGNTTSPYPAPRCTMKGNARGSYGEAFSLWTVHGFLDDGAELSWAPTHGDEALHILTGRLVYGETVCEAGASIIVEADAPAELRALGATEIMHFGPIDPEMPLGGPLGPAKREGHQVHIIGKEGREVTRHVSETGGISEQIFFADSTCPTCRLAIFRIRSSEAIAAPVHHHSEDEMMHILRGEMHLGTQVVPAGTSLGIKAYARYSFTSPGPIEFLNYRRDASYIVMNPNDPPKLGSIGKEGRSRMID